MMQLNLITGDVTLAGGLHVHVASMGSVRDMNDDLYDNDDDDDDGDGDGDGGCENDYGDDDGGKNDDGKCGDDDDDDGLGIW